MSESENAETLARRKSFGFEPCELPGQCEECKQHGPLFFGDLDYWDSREWRYYCGPCLDGQIDYVERCIESQMEHEATHMPWML